MQIKRSRNMKILVLGSSGQLGRCLVDQISLLDYDVTFGTRADFDITNGRLVRDEITRLKPTVIINAAAHTAVDKAEHQQDLAELINNKAVENIANICRDIGCGLIHISTDYVFDGQKDEPYHERDMTKPQSVYGRSKLAGERAIEASGCSYFILRTSWVFSAYGNNFLKTMLRIGRQRAKLNIVSDQIGFPTYAPDLAKAILKMVPFFQDGKQGGLYNYAGYPKCSWSDFARHIFCEAVSQKRMVIAPTVIDIPTTKYPTAAKRPMNSMLDSSQFEYKFDLKASDWKRGIRLALSFEELIL